MPSWLVVGITKRLCKVITAQQNQPLQITYKTPSNPPRNTANHTIGLLRKCMIPTKQDL
jgi:hypothetical protein